MTMRVTKTGMSGLCVLDCKARIWRVHRTFSTLPSLVSLGHRKRCLSIYFPLHKPDLKLIKHCTFNRSCRDLEIVRYMSTGKDPPEIMEQVSVDRNRETKSASERLNENGIDNMNLVKEKSSSLQAFGKHLSERSTSAILKITPEIQPSTSSEDKEKVKKHEDWNDIINRWYTKYQDFTGITELKTAQDRVTELSDGLLDAQSRRRILQAELEDLQGKLNVNHQRITKAELYSEEHYLLFDQARDMNARLKEVRTEFENCERTERDTFTQLSAAIRDCHEKERTQAEQSKYWSITASIISAVVASLFTSVTNWMRIRDIKDHVSSNNQLLLEGYQKMYEDVVLLNSAMTSTKAAVTENSKPSDKIEGAEVERHSTIKSVVEPTTVGVSSQVKLCEEDVILIGKTFGESVKDIMSNLLLSERRAIEETILPQFDTIFGQLKLILEGNMSLVELVSGGKNEDTKESLAEGMTKFEQPSSLPDDESAKEVPKTAVVEYSYKHIASAMAVGAGIGTLATAFLLGSFSGGSD